MFWQLDRIVLDEADEMLSMGFQENVEEILSYIPKGRARQMMLWSATVPSWVRGIARRFVRFVSLILIRVITTACNTY